MDYNARYYSTRLGRFVSPDSIVPNPLDSQAFNRYAYVNNNPVNHTDPSGHGCLVVCMYQEVTVGGGGSGGTGANPISVGETGGGGEVVLVAVALIAIPLAVEAGKTVRDIITPFPGTAPDLGTQPGISGDEYSSGGVIPGPPSDGEFTGPWVSSDPAELQQPNNPPGFPTDSGIELSHTSPAIYRGKQYSDKQLKKWGGSMSGKPNRDPVYSEGFKDFIEDQTGQPFIDKDWEKVMETWYLEDEDEYIENHYWRNNVAGQIK